MNISFYTSNVLPMISCYAHGTINHIMCSAKHLYISVRMIEAFSYNSKAVFGIFFINQVMCFGCLLPCMLPHTSCTEILVTLRTIFHSFFIYIVLTTRCATVFSTGIRAICKRREGTPFGHSAIYKIINCPLTFCF
jgi:hypothetical protein